MKTTFCLIDYPWLTRLTGDCFADAGGYAIQEFERKFPEKDILQLIEEVTKIYVYDWSARLNSFFLNSKITQPAFGSERKVAETLDYFRSLIEESLLPEVGYCRITGQKTALFEACRDNSILSGSAAFINFHTDFQGGLMVSKEALIRFYFVPFACSVLQGDVALIHSHNVWLTRLFVSENCRRNFRDLAIGISDGVLRSEYRSPATALFRFVDRVLSEKACSVSSSGDNLVLYHFTNFGASPQVRIYLLPSDLFYFYRFTQAPALKSDWDGFVSEHYVNPEYNDARYNEQAGEFEWLKGKSWCRIKRRDFACWNNRIYDCLLKERSILPYILRRAATHRFPWKIVEIYQTKIRNMKKESLTKLEEIADFIIRSNDVRLLGKHMTYLHAVKSSFLLRRFILKEVVSKYYLKNPLSGPLIRVEEFVGYLFPESDSWLEMRDVLLIILYQKLHEQNIRIDPEPDDGECAEGMEPFN